MRRTVLIAKNLRRLLTPCSNMNAPMRDAFDCSSRKPMRRHFVSGFPTALLSLSQEESSGVEIVLQRESRLKKYIYSRYCNYFVTIVRFLMRQRCGSSSRMKLLWTALHLGGQNQNMKSQIWSFHVVPLPTMAKKWAKDEKCTCRACRACKAIVFVH